MRLALEKIILNGLYKYLLFDNFKFIGIIQKLFLHEKRNREIGSFFSLRAMGALTGASPERAQIVGSGWQAYGENGIYECTFRDIENSATGGKK